MGYSCTIMASSVSSLERITLKLTIINKEIAVNALINTKSSVRLKVCVRLQMISILRPPHFDNLDYGLSQ